MTQRNLRAAVIGLGGMGRRHLEALSRTSIALAAVCDVNSSALESAAPRVGNSTHRHTDWRTLFGQESFDLVTIATNGPSHHEIALAAARAGVRFILCEKPMTTSGAKARSMAQVCAETGTRLAVNMPRRFAERYIRLKKALTDDVIGEVRHVNLSAGVGGLGCVGTHHFDVVSWLMDTHPKWVVGEIDADSPPNVRGPAFHDPGGRGMVGYACGMTASFQLSDSVANTPVMQIVGTHGYVDFNGWAPPSGYVNIYARTAAQRALPRTRFVAPERVPFDAGNAIDVVAATAACIDDLVGEHREDTTTGGIAAVDTVMAFHLSSQRALAKIDLPLTGHDLEFDVPIT